MTSMTKFHVFHKDLAEGAHNLGKDAFAVALVAEVPAVTSELLDDLKQVGYENMSSRTVLTVSSEQKNGVYRLILRSLVLTATGDVDTFRYLVLYNTANGRLVGFYDAGGDVKMKIGDGVTLYFNADAGAITLA